MCPLSREAVPGRIESSADISFSIRGAVPTAQRHKIISAKPGNSATSLDAVQPGTGGPDVQRSASAGHARGLLRVFMGIHLGSGQRRHLTISGPYRHPKRTDEAALTRPAQRRIRVQLLPATQRTRCATGQPRPGPVDASALMYGMDLFAHDNQSRPLDVEFVDGAEI